MGNCCSSPVTVDVSRGASNLSPVPSPVPIKDVIITKNEQRAPLLESQASSDDNSGIRSLKSFDPQTSSSPIESESSETQDTTRIMNAGATVDDESPNIAKAAVRVAEVVRISNPTPVKRSDIKHKLSEDAGQVLVEDDNIASGDDISYATLVDAANSTILDESVVVISTRKTTPTKDRQNPGTVTEVEQKSSFNKVSEQEHDSTPQLSATSSRKGSLDKSENLSAGEINGMGNKSQSTPNILEAKENNSGSLLLTPHRASTMDIEDSRRKMYEMLSKGHYFKKENRAKINQKKYFWIDADHKNLFWGKTNALKDAHGQLNLRKVTDVQKPTSGRNKDIAFVIVTEKRQLHLEADSSETRDKWVDALVMASSSRRSQRKGSVDVSFRDAESDED
eukprot:TRINITY_DN3083_c0_g1_i1.p1 TRINITY_DN3083_c0_g1~~TRINITY_DN3083_c0_g1_i1.p1  ORF type:complete len:394 (+),score=129.88 TRINITY_DN3083_c0_g1_i1:99-1280(+)